MQRIKLIIEYDGTNYLGWQSQKNKQSVQDAIEYALGILFKRPIRLTAAGRTDTGVHARNQVAHLDIPPYDLYRLKNSLNGLLNKDIVIKDIQNCAKEFHARFDALSRRYRYYISQAPVAINRNFVWPLYFPLNVSLMQTGAHLIEKTRDFKAFCKPKSDVQNYLCRIHTSKWFYRDNFLVFEIAANRFLHGMVRAIVGSLVSLGRGKISLQDFKDIISSGDRTKIPYTAPAQGLILEEVIYSN